MCSAIKTLQQLFTISVLCICCDMSWAAATQSHESIRQGSHDFLSQHYASYLNQGYARVDIKINQIDKRLKLSSCGAPLMYQQNNNRGLSNQTSIKVSCNAAKSWSIFIGARISAYARILVAAQPLVRGQILQAVDLLPELRQVGPNSSLYTDASQFVGMQLKRNLPQGEVIKANQLTYAKVIRRGDSVVLVAKLGSTQVATAATALSDGKVGQQIDVKNTQTSQVVRARVSGPGKVEVKL